jgi:hypothetical protein
MGIRLAEFSELLALFYEGLADAGVWRRFLEELCRRLDCDKAGLVCARHDSNPVMTVSVGLSEEFVKALNTYYGKIE